MNPVSPAKRPLLARTLLSAALFALLANVAVAQEKVLRIAMTAADAPKTISLGKPKPNQ